MTLEHIFRACKVRTQHRRALDLAREWYFVRGNTLTSEVCQAVMRAQIRGGEPLLALRFYDQLIEPTQERGVELTLPIRVAHFTALGMAGKTEKALEYIDAALRDRPVNLDPALTALPAAKAIADTNDPEAIAKVLSWIEPIIGLDVRALRSAVRMCRRTNDHHAFVRGVFDRYLDVAQAADYEEQMRVAWTRGREDADTVIGLEKLQRERGIPLLPIAYLHAVSALRKVGDWQGAVALVEEVEDRKLRVRNAVYETVQAACDAADQLQQSRYVAAIQARVGSVADPPKPPVARPREPVPDHVRKILMEDGYWESYKNKFQYHERAGAETNEHTDRMEKLQRAEEMEQKMLEVERRRRRADAEVFREAAKA